MDGYFRSSLHHDQQRTENRTCSSFTKEGVVPGCACADMPCKNTGHSKPSVQHRFVKYLDATATSRASGVQVLLFSNQSVLRGVSPVPCQKALGSTSGKVGAQVLSHLDYVTMGYGSDRTWNMLLQACNRACAKTTCAL